MRKLPHQPALTLPVLLLLLILMTLFACANDATPPPALTPGPEPSLTPQEAINKIEPFPFPFPYSEDGLVWNAIYNPNFGLWEVTMVRRVQGLYTSRDRLSTSLWYVTEETGEVEGPFMQPPSTSHLVPWRPALIQ